MCQAQGEQGRALQPYLSRRHVFKWYVAVCQLAGRYPYAVNVRFCIVTLEILEGKEKLSLVESRVTEDGQCP